MFFKVIYVITSNRGHFTMNFVSNLKYDFPDFPLFNRFLLINKVLK